MELRSMLLALFSPPLLQNARLGQKLQIFVSYRFPLGRACSKRHGKVAIMLRLLLRRRHECNKSARRCLSFLASSAKIPADPADQSVRVHACFVCV